MKKLKNERGAITIIVLVSMLFFTAFLVSSYLILANKSQSQIEMTKQTQEIYDNSNSIEDIYNSFFESDAVPIYTVEQLLKIGSNENIAINEIGGKIYNFGQDKDYILMNDLEFDVKDWESILGDGNNWIPIGYKAKKDSSFTGSFEGNAHKISVIDIENKERLYNEENQYYYNWSNHLGISDGNWNDSLNVPKLVDGLIPVYWDNNGIEITQDNEKFKITEWYNYVNQTAPTTRTSKWANAKTEDGSYWVWIPRYEYKITYYTNSAKTTLSANNGTTKTLYGNISVNLISTETTTASIGYKIHPAFIDGTDNNFQNGEWDDEIPGFWVAKFVAGYAGGNNSIIPKESNKTYNGVEAPSNFYGNITSGTTKMKYPVFLGNTFAYNFINIGNSYQLAKSLADEGNPYGLKNTDIDSHQTKNSEWGAIAYLAYSQYGSNGNEIYINNVNLNNTISTVYIVSGYAGETKDAGKNTTTLTALNAGTSGSYLWKTTNGQKASSTWNITGVFDLAGCAWERVSAYIANTKGASNRANYGSALINETNLKYKTIYPYNNVNDTVQTNYTIYNQNSSIRYGDSILETSLSGDGQNSWNSDYSVFANKVDSFLARGGQYTNQTGVGIFAFYYADGRGHNNHFSSFRAILICK